MKILQISFSDVRNLNAIYTLPELYQPLFGHSEFDSLAKRNCYDRLDSIKKVYSALSEKLQRPLRVLDLGCAQGFFTFHLANLGGIITAVDSDVVNVKCCERIAAENPALNVKIFCAKIEDFLPTVKPDEYDLVLGLSVFRDLYKDNGFDNVKKMLADLSKKIVVGIFEPEVIAEPESDFLPQRYIEVFEGFLIAKVLSMNIAENSEIKRPLVFVANGYIFFTNSGLLKIDSAHNHNFIGSTMHNKLYCTCGDKFVKIVVTHDETSAERIKREVEFLSDIRWGGDILKYTTTITPVTSAGGGILSFATDLRELLFKKKWTAAKILTSGILSSRF